MFYYEIILILEQSFSWIEHREVDNDMEYIVPLIISDSQVHAFSD